MRIIKLLCGCALVATQATAQIYFYQMVGLNPDVCNCPPQNVDSTIVKALVPAGRTFTGACDEVLGICETIEVGHYEDEEEIAIPPLHCLDYVEIELEYDSAILVSCEEDSECPSGVSYPATIRRWLPSFDPCLDECDPEDPGVEA